MAITKNVTYEAMAEAVCAKLGCGSDRINTGPTSLYWAWWPEAEPDFGDELKSSYGVPTGHPDLEREYFDEVRTIREILDEVGHIPKLSGWQRSVGEAGTRLLKQTK